MSAFPFLINYLILAMIMTIVARSATVNHVQLGYARTAAQAAAYHEAALVFSDANTAATGVVPRTTIDATLPAGITDPGIFISTITPPGTVTTCLQVSQAGSVNVAKIVQQLSLYNIFAGPVISGNIVPISPLTPVALVGAAPICIVAIQTIERNN
jgi:hypothetical protein